MSLTHSTAENRTRVLSDPKPAFYHCMSGLLQVDTVIVCGVMTNLCCETTARAAFELDFRVVFPSDGNATATQQLHVRFY